VTGVNVILVAGGQGRRLGGAIPKQFRLLAGAPILVRTARRFAGTAGLTRLIVVAAPAEHARCEALLAPLGLPLRLAPAGPERQHSVAAGVAALDPECAIAVVHDAARPLVRPEAIAACIAAARATGAALLATPVADTVKRCRDGRVLETVPRADLWLAQTPQAFQAEILRRAHAAAAAAGLPATDDAALVERLGLPVAIVPGDATNRKITTAEDLAWAETVLAGER
jgi:2-C-methyl-D-erythritol 4-phosphate cytidylyltransferase